MQPGPRGWSVILELIYNLELGVAASELFKCTSAVVLGVVGVRLLLCIQINILCPYMKEWETTNIRGNINIGARQQNKMFALVQSSNLRGCTMLMGAVYEATLLFKPHIAIAICLYGDLFSVKIFTCMKKSVLVTW